jgi:hypothetical protein
MGLMEPEQYDGTQADDDTEDTDTDDDAGT